jgi:ATP-dependent Lhr-like helicase
MSLPVSSSAPKASNLERLDERIQRWVWQKGWTGLRDAQEAAIPILLQADQDVIIAAATASGKTEAAFLPILSKLLSGGEEMGVALYISP